MKFLSFLLSFPFLFFLVRSQQNVSKKRCFKPLDVVFILDGSGSVRYNEWEEEKKFVYHVADSLFYHKKSRFALISFSSDVESYVDFESPNDISIDDFKNKIKKLRKGDSITNTHIALSKANDLFNSNRNNNALQNNTLKVVILVTDGISTNKNLAKYWAKKLINSGKILFVVGVGKDMELHCRELLQCHKTSFCPNYIHTNWIKLKTQIENLIEKVCQDPIETYCNPWSEWSACDCASYNEQRYRTLKSIYIDKKDSIFCPNEIRSCTGLEKCPINAGCGNTFTEWTPCSKTCGEGHQSRTRKNYNEPLAKNGGLTCEKQGILKVEYRLCEDRKCPVNAFCGEWSDWEECDAKCGLGVKSRKRKNYNNPPAKDGGLTCEKQGISRVDSTKCKLKDCPKDAQCSDFGVWSDCSVTCGNGIRNRERSCTSPTNGGKTPEDLGIKIKETERCKVAECPINAKCGEWSEWGACSTTCGGGERKRKRIQYNVPKAAFGGLTCENQKIPEISTESCNTNECPINASCGEFSNWTECSKTCGGGIRERHRMSYNYPPAKFNGLSCEAQGIKKFEKDICNNFECPIDAKCGEFGEWSQCSKSCGKGTKTRVRSNYNTPMALYNGKTCEQQNLYKEETKECNTHECPIDEDCGTPGEWSSCSVTCGKGVQERRRKNYKSKSAMFGGKTCEERGIIETTTRECSEDPCPIDAVCSEWGNYSQCTVSCGGGKQVRKRKVISPPQYNGKTCEELGYILEQENSCNTLPCPVNATCGEWSEWSICSVSCGKGTRKRSRIPFNDPPQKYGGLSCEDQGKKHFDEDNACNSEPCKINAVPGDWNEWGECTATCGSGTRTRKRKPPKVVEENGGLSLADQNIPEVMTENCPNLVPCGSCAFDWTEWTECSATCDIAYRTRHSARRYLSDHVCKTFENEQCKDLPTCEGSKTEESKSGTSTTTVLAACGASVAAACLLGGAGYYAKNALSSSPVMDAANFESADVDQSIEETENEEAVTIDADSELWMQDGEF